MAEATMTQILDDLRAADEITRRLERRYWLSSADFYDLYRQGVLDDGEHTDDFAEWSAYYQIKLDREAALSPVVVTKNGRAVAVILNVTDDDELERILLANSPKLRKILDTAEKRIQATGGMSHEDIWNTLEAAEEA